MIWDVGWRRPGACPLRSGWRFCFHWAKCRSCPLSGRLHSSIWHQVVWCKDASAKVNRCPCAHRGSCLGHACIHICVCIYVWIIAYGSQARMTPRKNIDRCQINLQSYSCVSIPVLFCIYVVMFSHIRLSMFTCCMCLHMIFPSGLFVISQWSTAPADVMLYV